MLVQTDTTVGFASQNADALARCKRRPPHKPFLKSYASLHEFKQAGRIPTRFKCELRRAKRTTYVVREKAFRIVSDGAYHHLLKAYGWLYSTSANAAGQRFDPGFAFNQADIVIEDTRGLYEDVPSHIYRLNKNIKRRIR